MKAFATIALLLVLACSAPAQQTSGDPAVAARVGDRAITMQEVEERWRKDDPAEHVKAAQALYEGRRQALDAIVADLLVEQAAKGKGVDPKQFVETELSRRANPVTDEEVAAFYKENQSLMQGRDLAAMGPVIRRFLEQQRRTAAYRALVADLGKAGPPVRVLLDAPRHEVAVAAEDPALGDADAPVTIVEFSDFQCPFCARVMPTLKRVRETYGDRVRIVWKDFPLTSIHPEAFKAAEAGNCAREQGRFWEYHDRLFGNQQALEPESLKKHAADAGLDPAKFNACLDAAKYRGRVQEQIELGNSLGVSSTPAMFINGRLVSGAQPYEMLAAIIDEELQRAANQ